MQIYNTREGWKWDLTGATLVATLAWKIVDREIIKGLKLYNIKLEDAGPYNNNKKAEYDEEREENEERGQRRKCKYECA